MFQGSQGEGSRERGKERGPGSFRALAHTLGTEGRPGGWKTYTERHLVISKRCLYCLEEVGIYLLFLQLELNDAEGAEEAVPWGWE